MGLPPRCQIPIDIGDIRTARAGDYLTWQGTESVTLLHTKRASVPPGRDRLAAQLKPVGEFITIAKRRAPRYSERLPSGGALLAADLDWNLPVPLITGPDPKPGDVIVDRDELRWTILDLTAGNLRLTWRTNCRNLAIVFDLRDVIDVQRAQLSYDAAGGAVKTFPPAGGQTLYSQISARVQPRQEQQEEERGIRGPRIDYDIIVERELAVSTEDRVLWQGVYLEIVRYRQAERIDELPILEAALVP